jgi:ferredoxin-type protein NapF
MASISRAQFLRGNWRGTETEIHPPWAVIPESFRAACDGCGECVTACQQNILALSVRGFPRVDFSTAECTFCGDCVSACPSGALSRKNPGPPWSIKARISNHCLAINGTSCVRCTEACEPEAILARPALGGRVNLSIDQDTCTGCGACVSTCPVKAISMQDATRSCQSNTHQERRIS